MPIPFQRLQLGDHMLFRAQIRPYKDFLPCGPKIVKDMKYNDHDAVCEPHVRVED